MFWLKNYIMSCKLSNNSVTFFHNFEFLNVNKFVF
jgi:hypothetical protein